MNEQESLVDDFSKTCSDVCEHEGVGKMCQSCGDIVIRVASVLVPIMVDAVKEARRTALKEGGIATLRSARTAFERTPIKRGEDPNAAVSATLTEFIAAVEDLS